MPILAHLCQLIINLCQIIGPESGFQSSSDAFTLPVVDINIDLTTHSCIKML